MTKLTPKMAQLVLIFAVLVDFVFMASSLPVPDSDSKPQGSNLTGAMTTEDIAWLDTWKAPGRLQEWFPLFRLGNDFEGSPVFLCPYGRWDFRKLVFQGTKEEKDGMDTYVKYVMAKFAEGAAKSETRSGVLIYDWDGFALASYAHPEAIRLTLQNFRLLVEDQKALNYGFFINTNFSAESFFDIAKPFLGNYLEKFEIYGTKKEKWLPRLLAKIPPDSLITQYGGKMEVPGF